METVKRRRKLFLEGPIVRALVTLAIPIVLGNVLQAGYQLTDAFWVGRLGASAVAAVSVSFPVTFLVIALGSGLAMAGATLAAQYMGAGRQDMVDHVTAQTMVMVAITSVVLGALGWIGERGIPGSRLIGRHRYGFYIMGTQAAAQNSTAFST